jgi:hypothetical protein
MAADDFCMWTLLDELTGVESVLTFPLGVGLRHCKILRLVLYSTLLTAIGCHRCTRLVQVAI